MLDSSPLWHKTSRQIGRDVYFDPSFLKFRGGQGMAEQRVSHHGGQKSDKGDARLGGFSLYSLQGPTCGNGVINTQDGSSISSQYCL